MTKRGRRGCTRARLGDPPRPAGGRLHRRVRPPPLGPAAAARRGHLLRRRPVPGAPHLRGRLPRTPHRPVPGLSVLLVLLHSLLLGHRALGVGGGLRLRHSLRRAGPLGATKKRDDGLHAARRLLKRTLLLREKGGKWGAIARRPAAWQTPTVGA